MRWDLARKPNRDTLGVMTLDLKRHHEPLSRLNYGSPLSILGQPRKQKS